MVLSGIDKDFIVIPSSRQDFELLLNSTNQLEVLVENDEAEVRAEGERVWDRVDDAVGDEKELNEDGVVAESRVEAAREVGRPCFGVTED